MIGTAVPYFAVFPFVMRVRAGRGAGAGGDTAAGVVPPAYVVGLALAGGLVLLRGFAEPDTVVSVLAASVVGVAGYWLAFYLVVMDTGERRLVREVAAGVVPRGKQRESA